MGDQSERKRRGIRSDRPVKPNIWTRLTEGLDADQTIVSPKRYKDNRGMYDRIDGVAYLIRGPHSGAELDWVWERNLNRVLERYPNTKVLEKQLIVRIRLPWHRLEHEWFCDQEELDENRDNYEIIDRYFRVKDRQTNEELTLIDANKFESNRDRYKLIRARYLVCWKMSKEEERRLLGPMIERDAFHVFVGE